MNITRDVIIDLWPLYEAGEASSDTKAAIEEFLAGDEEFARQIRQAPVPTLVPGCAGMRPDAEADALRRTRALVRGHSWLRGLQIMAMTFTVFALIRIISDTSWDVSPRPFIAAATLATICWCLYCFLIHRYRRRSLRPAERASP
jgi:hypothetical protein